MSLKWNDYTTYAQGDIVAALDNKSYESLEDDNLDHEPTVSPGWWKIYIRRFYLKNNETGTIGIFANSPQTGWTSATQEEIDNYLLNNAKESKVKELKGDLNNFLVGGYQYDGEIVCPAWVAETTYSAKELVVGSDSKNYESMAAENTGHDPTISPSWWSEFEPVFKMDTTSMLNINSKCKLDAGAADRYKFYAKGEASGFRHQIDFGDATKWDTFVKAVTLEEDRVMRKYNDYRIEIAECTTIAAVEAITIDFSV